MVLPGSVVFCDALEIAAVTLNKPLFERDIARQFFPNQPFADVEAEVKDALALAKSREAACGGTYPFAVSDRSIAYLSPDGFRVYLFLLFGRALQFGGPTEAESLLRKFRRYFEDVVSWSMRKSGFTAEVLSEPREFRGLSVQLAPALREIADRFREAAVLREDRLLPGDNDLDVDVLAVPRLGNASRGGWPTFQIQCATGSVTHLEAKLGEGASTFATVWEHGFFPGSRVRGVATPDDLLKLDPVHWLRLGQVGWVLDRTRIAYLSSGGAPALLLNEAAEFWQDLWAARGDFDWQTGWQQAN